MPVYQYACTQCDEELEVRQSFTDDALTVCPACEGRLRKVLNAVGVVFKGSGFYRTDSRAAAASNSPKTDKPANGTAKDSKPATPDATPKEPSKQNGIPVTTDSAPKPGPKSPARQTQPSQGG